MLKIVYLLLYSEFIQQHLYVMLSMLQFSIREEGRCLMKISVYVASAFSKDHKGGNKAGVVFIENTLTTTQKWQ